MIHNSTIMHYLSAKESVLAPVCAAHLNDRLPLSLRLLP